MTFKKRVIILASVAGALFLAYILSFVFSGESRTRRGATTALLDAKAARRAVSVSISGGEGSVFLEKQDGAWIVRSGELSYPAKSARVDDLLAALSAKAPYPVRASSEASWEKLGVSGSAPSITVKDPNLTLCELFFGLKDATGKEIYIRSAAGGPVRSGEDVFSVYLGNAEKSWYNLALFSSEKTKPQFGAVQRVALTPPARDDGERYAPYTLVRDGDGWKFEGGGAAKKSETDEMVRYIIDAQAEDFVPAESVSGADWSGSEGGAVLELGSGERVTLTAGPRVDERRAVKVSGSDYIYSLSSWAVNRMWRNKTELVEPEKKPDEKKQ